MNPKNDTDRATDEEQMNQRHIHRKLMIGMVLGLACVCACAALQWFGHYAVRVFQPRPMFCNRVGTHRFQIIPQWQKEYALDDGAGARLWCDFEDNALAILPTPPRGTVNNCYVVPGLHETTCVVIDSHGNRREVRITRARNRLRVVGSEGVVQSYGLLPGTATAAFEFGPLPNDSWFRVLQSHIDETAGGPGCLQPGSQRGIRSARDNNSLTGVTCSW